MVELEAKGLSKAYFLSHEKHCVVALQTIDFSLHVNEFVSIVGPSGCGKSTLLRLFAGFETKSSGTVLHRGLSIEAPHHTRSFIPQDSGLFEWLNIEENVMLPLHYMLLSKREKEEKVYRCMQKTGILSFAKAYPRELSGGMKQRAALSRALAMESQVILMDEPFSALDEVSREGMDEMMGSFFSENRISALLVTHSIREALLLSDRVVVMRGQPGRIFTTLAPTTPKKERSCSLEIETLHQEILGMLKLSYAL